MYEISYEDDTGILVSVNSGFWTPTVARNYMTDIARRAAETRAKGKMLKLLVDGRQAEVVSAETAAVLAEFEARVVCADTDRVAVIVGSSLAKLQTRRNFPSPQSEIFMSPSAARTWLTAYD